MDIVKIAKQAEKVSFGKHQIERHEKKVWLNGVLWALSKVEGGIAALETAGYDIEDFRL